MIEEPDSWNNFMLYIKVIRPSPTPPCEIAPPICINLNLYLESVEMTEDRNERAYIKAITDLLSMFSKTYKAPLGWFVHCQHYSTENTWLNPPPFNQPEMTDQAYSPEFLFDGSVEQPVIDVSFMAAFAMKDRTGREELLDG